MRMASRWMVWRMFAYNSLRLSQSLSVSSCATIISYGWNLRSSCKILLTDVFDMPKATACLRTERLGDCKIDALITLMFSGVHAVRGQPRGFLFNIETICLNLATHWRTAFRVGTSLLGGMRTCVQKACCVAMTVSLFLKNALTAKARYSPDQGMSPTENYRWWPNKGPLPQPSRPPLPWAMIFWNVVLLFGSPCMIPLSPWYWNYYSISISISISISLSLLYAQKK